MSLNWREIDCILNELKLTGSHIQKIKQPDYSSLIFEHYKPGERFSIFICLAQGRNRIHRLTRAPITDIKLQRFAQFLRSRILGGKIAEAYQVNGERVIRLAVERGGESTNIWIRLWGGAANVIVCDDRGVILDAFYRRPKKGEISGGYYNPEAGNSFPQKSEKKDEDYALRDIPGEGNFNEKIEKWYSDLENTQERERLSAKLELYFIQREIRIQSTLEKLTEKQKNYEHFEEYKDYGDLIIGNLHRITKGDTWLSADNFYKDNEKIVIQLDPELTPAENAEKYYQKYRKAKSGLKTLEEEISNLETAYEALKKQREIILNEKDAEKLRAYAQSLKEKKRKEDKPGIPGLQFKSGDFS
ncbi:MAG: NFACT family protein, partial [Spirochaetota bacterium]